MFFFIIFNLVCVAKYHFECSADIQAPAVVSSSNTGHSTDHVDDDSICTVDIHVHLNIICMGYVGLGEEVDGIIAKVSDDDDQRRLLDVGGADIFDIN